MTVAAVVRRCLLLCLLATVPALLPPPVQAQVQATASSAEQVSQAQQVLRDADRRLDRVRREMADAEATDSFRMLAEQSLQSQREGEEVARGLAPLLDQIDARIAQLGTVAEGSTEGRDIAAQRKALGAERSTVDGLVKQGNLVAVEAQQLAEAVERMRVQQFSRQLGQRVDSPLSPALWRKVATQLPQDLGRAETVLQQGGRAFSAGVKRHGWTGLLLAVAVAVLMAFPLRLWLRAAGRRLAASERAPKGRLRRSGLAVWLLSVGTVLPGAAVALVVGALRNIEAIPPRLLLLADEVVLASYLAAFIAALAACLLVPTRPSWRLLPLDDLAAAKLRKYAWMAAGLMWVSLVLPALSNAARTSPITGVAVDGILALGYIGLIGAMLVTLARLYRRQEALQANGEAPVRVRRNNGWLVLMRVVGHLTVIAALVAALCGWINLALYAAQQMIWIGVVALALLLLLKFADDLAMRLFAQDSRTGKALMLATGINDGRLEQVGVLLSALLRLSLVVLAIAAVTMPQGNTNLLIGWVDTVRNGLSIGDTVLRPAALVRALIVLVVGIGVVQLLQRWLVDTYLPRTGMDQGGRNSVSTVARYLGYFLVGLWTLGALGIGFEKLALVVSALSVGIGFGLQAITQNFVSGLILLAERPVKIGDLVRIGDTEGDVRRISVRATEIQMADKSTLVVPNSELITKPLRNMTLANPTGRVQIKFQVPLSTDITVLRDLLLDTYRSHAQVMDEPSPGFLVESIDGGMIAINSFGHVGSPRQVSSVRSDLLIDLLQRLAAAGIPLVTPTDIHLVRD